jgi:hypothetical protein
LENETSRIVVEAALPRLWLVNSCGNVQQFRPDLSRIHKESVRLFLFGSFCQEALNVQMDLIAHAAESIFSLCGLLVGIAAGTVALLDWRWLCLATAFCTCITLNRRFI